MLFIYRTLSLGGIETFFVRMAKERNKLGLHTKILLFSKPHESDTTLLREMSKYAEVIFAEQVFLNIPLLTKRTPVIVPIKKKALKDLFENVDQVHVSLGVHALLGYRLIKKLNLSIPITVGFYHYNVYLWGGSNVAKNVKIDRNFVFSYLPRKSLLFFSEGNKNFNQKSTSLDFSGSSTFRLGVVDHKDNEIKGSTHSPLKIVAVGRLEEFKSYNLYMIDTVKNLKSKGIEVQFDIYGDGPLKEQMQKNINIEGLETQVHLKGKLDYLNFDNTVMEYDLFIGSGTSIIQAASLGVPSIVGIENFNLPETYGFFSSVYEHEYNLKGIDLPTVNVIKLIEKYIDLDINERLSLKTAHKECIESFTNASCQQYLSNLNIVEMPSSPYKYNRLFYSLSLLFDGVKIKLFKNHPYNRRHRDFKVGEKAL